METQLTYKEGYGRVIKKTFSGRDRSREQDLISFITDLSRKGLIDLKLFSEQFIKTGIQAQGIQTQEPSPAPISQDLPGSQPEGSARIRVNSGLILGAK